MSSPKTIPSDTLKVVFLGESDVGKNSIILKLISDSGVFDPDMSSSAQFITKTIELKDINKVIKFDIWDTAGQERFRSISKIFYNDANAVILVYDITNKKSLEEIQKYWYNQILEYSPKDINK